ncbi:MAG: glycosyltransferase family 4 protein [Eubacteriales bacterium]|nr:glycosyltransferase family 4 protein [Eubacteriales bacterium]
MKIAHVGLASYYTDGMAYQDNQLAEQNVRDGHKVLYVSNAQKYESGMIVDTGYEDIMLPCGVRLVRLPYIRVLGRFFSEKLRAVRGLYALLTDFSPDVILCHDLTAWSVRDVVHYKRLHPEVKLYADTHACAANSGRNWLSLHLLHRGLYRLCMRTALPYLEKYFYITSDCRRFSDKNYGVPASIMEFYPLGGVMPDDEAYRMWRMKRRAELCMEDNELLFVHSGKLDAEKRTEELLKAFAAVPELKARLVVIGSMTDDMKSVLLPLMAADSRVEYMGWRNAEELKEYLCAADMYLQPGSESSTMQNAVCASCPVMLYPHRSYIEGYDYGNIVWTKTAGDMEDCFRKIAVGELRLDVLAEKSRMCALELLDYRRLAERLYR